MSLASTIAAPVATVCILELAKSVFGTAPTMFFVIVLLVACLGFMWGAERRPERPPRRDK